MNTTQIIIIILIIGLIISSDKLGFIKERTEGFKKAKNFYLTLVSIFILIFLIYTVITNWSEIDWFRGSGGNPQESYQDQL